MEASPGRVSRQSAIIMPAAAPLRFYRQRKPRRLDRITDVLNAGA